ncbi:MAG: hypothetical protein WBB24_10410 [Maribacter sp.]
MVNQLKLNWRIIKEYSKEDKVTIGSGGLSELGFVSNFIIHYWKNQRGEVYLLLNEYGFLKKQVNG